MQISVIGKVEHGVRPVLHAPRHHHRPRQEHLGHRRRAPPGIPTIRTKSNPNNIMVKYSLVILTGGGGKLSHVSVLSYIW